MKTQEFLGQIEQREFNTNETFRLLKSGGAIFWSWGTSNTISYRNKVLMLQVNAMHHKGKVYVTLAWNDTYTVYITTNQNRVKEKFEDIYFDMLVETIDNVIERIEAYQ